jgi:hypothetical protein
MINYIFFIFLAQANEVESSYIRNGSWDIGHSELTDTADSRTGSRYRILTYFNNSFHWTALSSGQRWMRIG